MSDQSNESPKLEPHVLPQDWCLEYFVDRANQSAERGFGITLNLHGLMVSGYLIGAKRYFDGLATETGRNLAQSGAPPEEVAQVESFFKELGEPFDPTKSQSEQRLPPNFIHLEDAQFFFGSSIPIPSNQGTRWRGRISQVDGFIFGTLGVG